MRSARALLAVLALAANAAAQERPRARDLGVPFDGSPGRYNAITDVAGVEVGHTTLIEGRGALTPGKGPVRTGVTAVLPRGRHALDPVFAAWFALNGNGEMTGTAWIDESGLLEGPVLLTNTHSVGVVRDAVVRWMLRQGARFDWALPVVAETWDGVLNDLNGFHVRPEHAMGALDAARSGPVTEGAVGGGTGMICNGFKGGIGTASRVVPADAGGWTVGVLVQCNYGSRQGLRIAGAPVGRELQEPAICLAGRARPTRAFLQRLRPCARAGAGLPPLETEHGSIIVIVATDAPLLPHQLERLVKRVSLGLGREGSIASNYSGDLFVAFSTAAAGLDRDTTALPVLMLPNGRLDPLFAATVQATEEAITNALVAAETMTGADDIRVPALPHDSLRAVLRRYNRLESPRSR